MTNIVEFKGALSPAANENFSCTAVTLYELNSLITTLDFLTADRDAEEARAARFALDAAKSMIQVISAISRMNSEASRDWEFMMMHVEHGVVSIAIRQWRNAEKTTISLFHALIVMRDELNRYYQKECVRQARRAV
jgi:hypothetical protein